MTPIMCQVKHNPPESYGDCLRACVATVLSRTNAGSTPHFYRDGRTAVQATVELADFLRCHHLVPVMKQLPNIVGVPDALEMIAEELPGVLYLLFNDNHVVVCRDDKIIHNPSWIKETFRTGENPLTFMIFVRA